VVAVVVAGLSVRWPDLGLGPSYAGATAALAVLLVGGAADAASKVLTVQASATGLPWVAVRAECVRWAVLGVSWLALAWLMQGELASALPGAPAPRTPGLLPLCGAWAAAAIASAVVFAWHGRARDHAIAGAAA
jgi:hypothetical protein